MDVAAATATTGSSSLDRQVASDCSTAAMTTTASELECQIRTTKKYETLLEKDFLTLKALAATHSDQSVMYFKLADNAFKDYVEHNCESERHDVFGGSLEDLVDQKCRQDSYLERRRLYLSIIEPNLDKRSVGFFADLFYQRPVCEILGTVTEVLPAPNKSGKPNDVEALRLLLDKASTRAAQSGIYVDSDRGFRQSHIEAEKQNGIDANLMCLGIQVGFCPYVSRDQWLSRCQTQLQSAFYKRTRTRLRALQTQ